MYSKLSRRERQKMDRIVVWAIKKRSPVKAKGHSSHLAETECINNISRILRKADFKELLKMFLYPNNSLKRYVMWEVRCRIQERR